MSSQDASLVITPVASITQTSASPVPPAIPPIFETVTTDSTNALPSQTQDEIPVSTTQNNDNSALTTTSGASSGASISTSDIIIGTPATTTGSGQLDPSEASAGLTNGAENNNTGSAVNTKTTVAVAGGVIGGLALISILLLLIWFWRKRLKKNRRSTLLTPLSTGPAVGGDEDGSYGVPRDSLGPTSFPEKMRAMVGYVHQRLRGRVNGLVTRSPKLGMDLNPGNSQFGPRDAPVTSSASRAEVASTEAMATKGRFVDWWRRLIEDGNLNWKLRNDSKSRRSNDDVYVSMPTVEQSGNQGFQSDFVTHLSTDEKQHRQQEASDDTAALSNRRRSQSLGGDHFFGGLSLNFNENPFVDSNAMRHDSAGVMPLTTSRAEASNPFSDANALLMPVAPAHNNNNDAQAGGAATYIQTVRRSRGYSVSAASTRPSSCATAGRIPSSYRGSSVSVETSDTRRNKFRSDPFDLDKPDLFAQSPGSSARGGAGGSDGGQGGGYSNVQGLPNMPQPTHARRESLTPKYPSGLSSMADWGDPGPDVGPAAGRWNMPGPNGALGP